MAGTTPIDYSDDIEIPLPDEDAIADDAIATMRHMMETRFEQYRHAHTATHAKTHGVLTGALTVSAELPSELAQGLFAGPATYEVVLRLASEPGDLDPDTAHRARGAALKVLDVPGEKLVTGWTSQDFLFNTWPAIAEGDAATFAEVLKQRDQHAGHHLRTVAGTLKTNPSLHETDFDRTPNIHPLAFTYYSQAAFRYGDHIAKFALTPALDAQRELAKQKVGRNDPPGVLREWIADWFSDHEARFDVQVQLCTDLDAMPVEDASVPWPEDVSPYRTVATVVLPAQDAFDARRRVHAEDVMAWRPWNGLAAHRPLGSLNRLRKRVYEELGQFRHDTNGVRQHDPVRLAELP